GYKPNRSQTVLALLLLGLSAGLKLTAQGILSPKDVLDAYRKLDASGGRLNRSGWERAAKYFVKPRPWPERNAIGVMYGEEIYDVRVDGNEARVWVTRGAVGQIEPSGRFTAAVLPELMDSSSKRGSKVRVSDYIYGPTRIDIVYKLRLSETYPEF